jgi:hypothetical protein
MFIVQDLFYIEFSQYLGTTAGGFIGISRYILKQWPDLTWFPQWYSGIPYQNTYPPLFHLLVAAIAKLFAFSAARAYYIASALVYALGPVTLFWMALRLTKSRTYALGAGLLYSLISPSVFLISEVSADNGGLLGARRLFSMVRWGDTPQVAAMTLIPLAIVLLDIALEKRRSLYYYLAAFGMSSVALTNWLGAFGLAVALLAYLIAFHSATPRRSWLTAISIGVLAYLLICPWLPPSTVNIVRRNSAFVEGAFDMGVVRPVGFALAIVAAFMAERFLRRWLSPMSIFVLYFGAATAALALSAYWFGIWLMPQPKRYHLLMEMPLCLAIAHGLNQWMRRLDKNGKLALAIGFALFCSFQLVNYREYARETDIGIDIKTTVDYKIAAWFDSNMQGRRVLAAGSNHMLLNAISDTPQLSGGFDQGCINLRIPASTHLFFRGGQIDPDGKLSLLWLKALGVHAIAVGGPKTAEVWHSFDNAQRYANLPELWREGDDFIYAVPQRSSSLARVIGQGQAVQHTPVSQLDTKETARYVEALDDSAFPLASFEWLNAHAARVSSNLQRGQELSIQMTFHPGWHAKANGVPREIREDGLGMMLIEPNSEGPTTIELNYDGGIEMQVAHFLSWATLAAGALWAIIRRKRQRK